MSDSGPEWQDIPLWKEAEAIYQRWKNEEFDFDAKNPDAKMVIEQSYMDGPSYGQKGKTYSKKKGTLVSLFSDTLAEWPSLRVMSPQWVLPARYLINAYATARSHGCIVAGPSIKKELGEREHRIVQLDSENEGLKAKLAEWEGKYQKCFEHANGLEIKLAEIENSKDAQRQADIRDSMRSGGGTNQSEVKPNDD